MHDRGLVARIEEDETKYLKKTVVEFISKAEVSKAVSRLNSTGVANMSNPAVIEQMRRNYPEQLVLSKSGAGIFLNLVRRMMETRREYVAVKVDIYNAFI